jgi:hypothetical protein
MVVERWCLFLVSFSVAATAASQAGSPQHLVTFMANSGQTECPDQWTEAGYALGRLLLATTNADHLLASAGTPTANAEAPGHDHGFKVSGTVEETENFKFPSGSYDAAAGGSVEASGTTASHGANLPFVQFLVCEHLGTSAADAMPFGTVAFFNAESCPADWHTLDQADGRFLLPSSPGLEVGFATEETWNPAEPPSHTHSVAASFKAQTTKLLLEQEEMAPGYAKSGDYDLEGKAAESGPLLPFVALLACVRTTGIGNSAGVPSGTTIFFGGKDCPDGWGRTIGADGRFVVGIGGNGTQGAPFGGEPIQPGSAAVTHDHAFAGQVQLHTNPPPRAGPPGFDHGSWPFVTVGPFEYSGTSTSASGKVPYLVLQSCTKE